MVLDGKKIAGDILEGLKKFPKPKEFLGAFLVGDPPTLGLASVSFLKQKENIAKELGVSFRVYKFSASITQDDLRKEVLKVANHKMCGGVIVQLPLPRHINAQYVLNVIPREKDVDVLGERALGAFYAGRNPIFPPAVGVLRKIIQNTKIEIQNSKIAVVGLGILVGMPITTWLMKKCAELYALDKGSDLGILREADFVICGAGVPGLIKAQMLKEGAGVIDFGYGSTLDGKISGDFDASSGFSKLLFYTPTPHGTGPILIAELFENFYTSVRA